VIEHISDRIAVMYLGKIVEMAKTDELFDEPLHPYTRALLSAIPVIHRFDDLGRVPGVLSAHRSIDESDFAKQNLPNKKGRIILKGDVPSPINPPSGCRFHPRCPEARDICKKHEPELRDAGNDHFVACHLV
jgi:oligopeptide/dipeptide ABC transporter ATP-binding protein